MVNERERYEGEEEYHFSDEQMDYDVEAEEPIKAAPPPPAKESLVSRISKVTSRRRAVVAGVVFILLIAVIYNMLAPSKPKLQNVAQELSEPAAKPLTPINTPVVEVPTQPKMVKPIEKAEVPPPAKTPPAEPQVVSAPPVQQAVTAPAQSLMPATPPTPTVTVVPPVQPQITTTPVNTTPPPPLPEGQMKVIMDRLTALEQQNAALMQLLQTEYAQKISEYETQGNLIRGKIDEITKRLNKMDSEVNQVERAEAGKPAIIPENIPATKPEVKIGYSVQAIIPGRAWLKSETGDTVTVAEGDILRNYGRITKIDPYDGVVEIDTGGKTISISYGMNVE